MALVFVHGIGNRSGSAYTNKVALRDALFRRFLLARALPELNDTPIHSPMWGDLGASLAWDHAALITGRGERLGGGGDPFVADLLAAVDPEREGRPLVRVAQRNLRDAVDLLYTFVDVRGRSTTEIEELADVAVELTDWCNQRATEADSWLAETEDDLELVELLIRRAAPPSSPATGETLGSGGALRATAHAVLTAAVDGYRRQNIGPPNRYAAAALRRFAARPVSLLIGDVLAYLGNRGTPAAPGPIASLVTKAFEAASADGPLVVVAHSMGGNIAYDLLSHFCDFEVDTFVTVGSQVGLFEELKLFAASDSRIPDVHIARVPALPNVRHWINIVDRGDVLAYHAAGIFDGVLDYEYPTDAVWAHGAYFRQPNFHARLATRVREARA